MTNDDKELIGLYVFKNNQLAFERLVAKHAPMVMHVCRSFLLNQNDCDDVVQSVFVLLAKKSRGLVRHSCIGGWLHNTAVKISMSYRRKKKRNREVAIDADLAAEVMEPWESISQAQACEMLHREIANLPDKYRDPIVMCLLNGLTRAQAAENLDTTTSSVKAALARGRRLLRQRLIKQGVALSVIALTARQCIANTADSVGSLSSNLVSNSVGFGSANLSGAVSSAGIAGTTIGLVQVSLVAALVCVVLGTATIGAFGAFRESTVVIPETTVIVDQANNIQESQAADVVQNDELEQDVSVQLEKEIAAIEIKIATLESKLGQGHPQVKAEIEKLEIYRKMLTDSGGQKELEHSRLIEVLQKDDAIRLAGELEKQVSEIEARIANLNAKFGPLHPQLKVESAKLEEPSEKPREKRSDVSRNFDLRRELAKSVKMPLDQLPEGIEDVVSPIQKVAARILWAEKEFGKEHPETMALKKQMRQLIEKQNELVVKMFGVKPALAGAVVESPEELSKTWVEILKKEKAGGIAGYLATDFQGKKLRKFIDSNGDEKLDIWIYYNGGVETYRDVDKDFDGKVDGVILVDGDLVRIGSDTDQDGKIDSWKERALPSNLDRWKPELLRKIPRR